MSNQLVIIDELKQLFAAETPLIDLRAPVEFEQGSLPESVNIPILNTEERALIGTAYKHQGQEAAIRLGYQIVSGPVKKERVAHWCQFVAENPHAVLYCFRGGRRSQIAQQWLKDTGVERPLLAGGYKAARRFLMRFIEEFGAKNRFILLSGPTGSGKTALINAVKNFYPALDLECLAHHRGSAFGAWRIPQPAQIDFENRLAVALMKLENKLLPQTSLLVEDESRHIGKNCLPDSFFIHLRNSEVIWLDEPRAVRVDNIFNDYILNTVIGHAFQKTGAEGKSMQEQALTVFEYYKKALVAISKKLGGLRTREIMIDLASARLDFLNRNEIQSNKIWIEKLLTYYYDPLYLKSLKRRQVTVIFKGSNSAVIEYLKNGTNDFAANRPGYQHARFSTDVS
ncbi:tRNA 2-selenouridine synthase [Nitrosomonas sp. Nm51]|uniref:tRNA 2-selenouridine(34) synthase MnmH n=1 Tax=Nitrosomonas sp. Nm51 TaxID=133720 RepID=UPI0008C96D71|nr:tRNA 2-selenouridine(34) synthase MnmH [Nitrosomonas sp. Nm51]SER26618.1 tRNA 2-selenouridine synthase [Nitrosomonas sp. Nm51]